MGAGHEVMLTQVSQRETLYAEMYMVTTLHLFTLFLTSFLKWDKYSSFLNVFVFYFLALPG